MEPIFISAADVKAKAAEAFRKGALQAQRNPLFGNRYSGPCAIGVALTHEQRRRLDGIDDSSIHRLFNAGHVESDDRVYLINVQDAHDNRHMDELARLLGIEDTTHD